MLIVKNLEKNFGKTKVLKNINLEINEKERVVIIGPLAVENQHYFVVLIK